MQRGESKERNLIVQSDMGACITISISLRQKFFLSEEDLIMNDTVLESLFLAFL